MRPSPYCYAGWSQSQAGCQRTLQGSMGSWDGARRSVRGQEGQGLPPSLASRKLHNRDVYFW